MTEFTEPVFYIPGTTTIIDNAVDRAGVLVGHYSGETLEQIRLRHPGVALGEWDEVYAETEASCKTEPVEITEDEFLKALNVLRPVRGTQRSDSESFKNIRTSLWLNPSYLRAHSRSLLHLLRQHHYPPRPLR